jgi:ppGpp synthetase/RelA/SpoT-type nucleotidyltranferase
MIAVSPESLQKLRKYRLSGSVTLIPPKRIVKAFSPDEARDDHGRWTQGGFGLVSPNEEENLDFDKAVAKLGSEGQTKLLQLGESISKQIGVSLTQQSAIGDWSDGAENSIFQKYTGAEAEDIKYAASLMGDAANQKAVIAFSPSAEGKDRFYQFSLNMDAKAARKALDDAGIQFRTLIPNAGTTKVAVFDPGGELSDKIGAVSEKYNAVIDQKRGTGEFIGADSREEAHNVYHQVIQQYESSHSRHYRRLAAAARELRNSRRHQKEIASGGPGSGCHGPNCGRPAGLIKLPGSLGITRGKMPQIKSAFRNHYLGWLRKQGIGHTRETVAPETLRPTQKNINPTSMAKLKQGGGEGAKLTKTKPMIISRDNYIMDGHHRWHDAIGSDDKLNVIRIDAPMKQLLRITDNYPHAEYRSSKGLDVAAYSPDQPRDDSGKWTDGGGTGPVTKVYGKYQKAYSSVKNLITSRISKYGKVEARLKTLESLKGKLDNGVPLKKVGDIMGFRVTTSDVKSVYNAVDKIKGELKGTGIDIRQISDKIQEPRDGYRAVHMDLTINGMRAELQVRTENQSKWADWAHDLIYKGRLHGSPEAQRYASKVSDALYKMDRGKQANMPPCPPVIKPNCFSLSP